MAAILRDSVTVVVVRTRPRAIPLAMVTMEKIIDVFPFLSHMSMGHRSSAKSYPQHQMTHISIACLTLRRVS